MKVGARKKIVVFDCSVLLHPARPPSLVLPIVPPVRAQATHTSATSGREERDDGKIGSNENGLVYGTDIIYGMVMMTKRTATCLDRFRTCLVCISLIPLNLPWSYPSLVHDQERKEGHKLTLHARLLQASQS